MISPELKQKFEELFVDEFTEDQYEQWKDEIVYQANTNSRNKEIRF